MSDLPKNFGKIPKQPVKFTDLLSGLCAIELCAAKGDPERIGEMIERLLNSLAFTIAIAAHGDPKGVDEMLKGAEAYLYDCATRHAPISQKLEAAKRTAKP